MAISSPPRPGRLASIDAYRGFVMLAMASEGLGLAAVTRKHFPDSDVWRALAYQFDHVAWTGCAAWDLIQPSFMFLVGVAMPFSFAARQARGDSWGRQFFHAVIRSFVLVALGVILYSLGDYKRTNFIFPNVLAQIGLGYAFVFLTLGRGLAVQAVTAAVVLGGYWYAFYQHPVGGAEEAALLGLKPDWHQFDGFAAHWNKHLNFAGSFDRWFLNQFPRDKPFVANEGGYQTLNFVPSMATMLFGVMAGELLRGGLRGATKRNLLLGAGLLCLTAGLALDHTLWPERDHVLTLLDQPTAVVDAGPFDRPFADPTWTIGPAVKKIWTPTWAVFSTGWTLVVLAGFYTVIDLWDRRGWAFPLIVVGMNSIVIYILASTIDHAIVVNLRRHLGNGLFDGTYGPIWERVGVVVVLWLICYWMYRQKAFPRI
jgi:predicted acyltransferase